MATVYVDPLRGSNRNNGQQNSPFKTLTYALRQVESDSRIQLQPGTYSADSGEGFPLRIPEGVIVTGNATNHGRNTRIYGGGSFRSAEFGAQWATVLLENACDLRGITITNPIERGTGVWIESASPTIAYCTLMHCRREGIFILGRSAPLIHNCIVEANAASGVFVARQAKGELRHNRFQKTGYGVAISDQAAPFVIDNQFIDNRSGLVISRSARPVLRANLIARSQGDGLAVLDNALPDLGDREDPGRNVFEASQGFDVRNETSMPLRTSGNQINPTKISGAIRQEASLIPPVVLRSPNGPDVPPPPSQPETSPPAPPTTPAAFPDIANHWARPFIEALAQRNLVSGFPDGTFRPEAKLTRAEYAALLAQAFSRPNRRLSQGFADVADSFWAAAAIHKAERMGFIAGFPDGTFRPQQPLTRLQILLSLVNGLSLQGSGTTSLSVYQDRAEIPSYAARAVAIATQQQLVVNYPNPSLLEPSVPASRAETAAILYQALVVTGEVASIPSPYIVIPSAAAAAFADVQSQWGMPYIYGMASQGYMGGFADGTFHPDDPVSRAQYAVWLDQTLSLSAQFAVDSNPPEKQHAQSAEVISDLSSAHWAYGAIGRVVAAKLLTLDADGAFHPDAHLIRADLWQSLAAGISPSSAQSIAQSIAPQQAIAQLQQIGIQLPPKMAHSSGDRAATRSDVAALLYQVLVYFRRAEPIAPRLGAVGDRAADHPSGQTATEPITEPINDEPNQQMSSAPARFSQATRTDAASSQRRLTRLKRSEKRNEKRSPLAILSADPVVVALAADFKATAFDAEANPRFDSKQAQQQAAWAIASEISLQLKRQGVCIHQVPAAAAQPPREALMELAQATHAQVAMLVQTRWALDDAALNDAIDQPPSDWCIRYTASSQKSSEPSASKSLAAALAEAIGWQLLELTDLRPGSIEGSDDEKSVLPCPQVDIQFMACPATSDLLRGWAEAIAQGILLYVQRYGSP